jgi:hypothetical protein
MIPNDSEQEVEDTVPFSRKLSRLRTQKGWTQQEMAVCAFFEKVDIKNHRFDGVYNPIEDEWSRSMREVMAAFRRGAKEFSDNEIDAIVDEAVGAGRQTG